MDVKKEPYIPSLEKAKDMFFNGSEKQKNWARKLLVNIYGFDNDYSPKDEGEPPVDYSKL